MCGNLLALSCVLPLTALNERSAIWFQSTWTPHLTFHAGLTTMPVQQMSSRNPLILRASMMIWFPRTLTKNLPPSQNIPVPSVPQVPGELATPPGPLAVDPCQDSDVSTTPPDVSSTPCQDLPVFPPNPVPEQSAPPSRCPSPRRSSRPSRRPAYLRDYVC